MTHFGSPFYNTGAGRTPFDWKNKRRLRLGMRNWWKSLEPEEKKKYNAFIGYDKVGYARIGGPILGLALGKFFTDAYCSPRFFYFRFFMMFLFTCIGYKYGKCV